MIATNDAMPRAFAVWWRELPCWSVKSFHLSQWKWSESSIKKLACVLERKSVVVDKKSFKPKSDHFISIRFSGEVEIRDLHGKKEFKGSLFFAYAGDLIYSKIDVRNGAIGIIPEDIPVAVVTSEFPIYHIKEDAALPEYIKLVFRTRNFRKIINGMVSGASGRKRVQPDKLENIKIPLPSLVEQKAIVERWHKAQVEIATIEDRISATTLELENGLLRQIGLTIEPPTPQRGAFKLSWNTLERWDTFFYRKDFVALSQSLSRIKRKKLGELAHFISRPWHTNEFPEGFFNYVEISSVNKENGIFSSKKVEIKNAPSRATTLIRKSDLIISTTRPYLGAIAIVPEEYDNHVCSSGFALVDAVDESIILKEYLLFFLTSQGGLKQMEQRMTGGLYPAITQDELEIIEIPLPSLAVQKKIIERVAAGREVIARERETADRLSKEINEEIEALILGTKRVEDIEKH